MDNNYLYIIGFLGMLLVTFVVFHFFKKRTNNELTENDEEEHNKQEDNIECDGDKCFIKKRQTKYDKCDDENYI
jgi:phosphotransferase system  glucose/maltose/N-acetylglucosamine-specific IIC component